MRTSLPLLLALIAVLNAQQLHAQRTAIGGRSIPFGAHLPPRSPRVPPRPSPTVGVVPRLAGLRGHRPMPFRSSVFGLAMIDPYWWLAPAAGEPSLAVSMPSSPALPRGGAQLDVEPRSAFVYVDGVLAGRVDQFSGYYQHLEATAGLHVIDMVAPHYEPLTILVTVIPNQTTTYRASMNGR